MKKINYQSIVASILWLMFMSACTEKKSDSSVEKLDPFNGVNLETARNLELSETRNTDLKVVLMNDAATREIENGNLHPNSIYALVATSNQTAKLVVRKTEYFEILSQKTDGNKTIFTIKTSQKDFVPDLFISIVPVILESNVLMRQPARGFLISK